MDEQQNTQYSDLPRAHTPNGIVVGDMTTTSLSMNDGRDPIDWDDTGEPVADKFAELERIATFLLQFYRIQQSQLFVFLAVHHRVILPVHPDNLINAILTRYSSKSQNSFPISSQLASGGRFKIFV
ncbi:hypothetical protein HDV00_011343, partial [Rhizophlyctis rosea]